MMMLAQFHMEAESGYTLRRAKRRGFKENVFLASKTAALFPLSPLLGKSEQQSFIEAPDQQTRTWRNANFHPAPFVLHGEQSAGS